MSESSIGFAVDVEAVSGDAVVVIISVDIGDEIRQFTGVAKRTRGDDPNAEIGLLLAYGRAFEKVARFLQRRGDGLVRHADGIREHKRMRDAMSAAERAKVRRRTAKRTAKRRAD